MNKESIMFGVIGLLGGLIIGFMFANSVNQRGTVQSATAAAPPASNMPPGHPDIGNSQGAPGVQKGMQPEVQAAIDKAKQAPKDFDAQIKAAEVYYQIDRFDDAITYLKKANELKPDDREVMVHLGNASFDADHFEDAEKWYMAALAKKEEINVRTDLGLTFVFRSTPDYERAIQEFNRSLAADPNHVQTLQNLTVAYTKKGDAAKAKATLAKLESVDSSNSAIAKLKEDIQQLEAK
jgi:tetratricopeptide (TPR) repeat protein